jgi:hypothetical protein
MALRGGFRNQFGRRNLSTYDRSLLAGRLKDVIAARAKENEIAGGGDKKSQSAKSGSPKLANPKIDTREELAQIAGVSHDTISKVEKIEAQVIPEIKEKIRHGVQRDASATQIPIRKRPAITYL